MRPIIFDIFGEPLSSYYFFISLGILIGTYILYRNSKKAGLNTAYMLDIAIICIISGYIGGRLFHIIFSMPSYYINNPLEIFQFWKGGYAIYGAIIFPILFIYLYARYRKIPTLSVTDALAPALSAGTFIGRIGCLLQGCCYGKISSVPWAITDTFGIDRHPTQIYLSLHGLIMFLILTYIYRHKKYDGQTTYWYFLLYSSGRFIIEMFRADERGGFLGMSSFQMISIILFVWSIYKIRKNRNKYA